jgi:poly-gamma-glutamate synthesis protein (capsule biosynthesis protein)
MHARALLPLLLTFALQFAVAPASAAPLPRSLRLTFIGDIMAHEQNYRMQDFRDIYRGVERFFAASDLTVANLELPVDPARPESGYPLFNGSIPYVRAALDAGVGLLSVANNHAFDGGVTGVFQTLRSLESLRRDGERIRWSGIRGNLHRTWVPESLSVNGVRVGFIAVTQFLNDPGGDRWVNVVDYMDEEAVRDFLRFVRRTSPDYDLFIVSYHGDREYVQQPSAMKRAFFHRLIEAGAHIVYGHHPHVVQSFERVRVNGADRLIMYSMGNFISAMTWGLDPLMIDHPVAPTGESYLLRVDVMCSAAGCSVSAAECIPIANYRNSRGEMLVAALSDLVGGVEGESAAWRAYYAVRLSRMQSFLGIPAASPVSRAEGAGGPPSEPGVAR